MRRRHLRQRRADLLLVSLLPEGRLAAGLLLLEERWAAELVPRAFARLALQAGDASHGDRQPGQDALQQPDNSAMQSAGDRGQSAAHGNANLLSALSAQSCC